jgi:oligoendopeptidase F
MTENSPGVAPANVDTVRAIEWRDGVLLLLDQRLLPGEERRITLSTVEQVWEAIRSLRVRGAPAIGIAAAYGLAIAARASTATDREDRGAFLQEVREAYTRVHQELLFVETSWARLPEERARPLIDAEELEAYRHFLEVEYEKREHVLSEKEETVLSEKQLHGRSAWTRYFDEQFGDATFSFRGEELPKQAVLSKLYEPDRSVRRDAAAALTEGLEDRKRTLTFVFNTVLADKASDDRLRGYDHWLEERNLENEIAEETVEALVDTVTGRYDLVGRFYRLKAELLGLDPLMDYDRYAPVGTVDRRYDWSEAREIVLDAFYDFDERFAQTATTTFQQGSDGYSGTVDTYIEDGKWPNV